MNGLKNYKVLFLEDNEIFAEHTIDFLELYLKQVIHCVNMKDAIEVFKQESIDIIISDLKVEDGLALSFIEEIRTLSKSIPIVVLSAHKDEEFLLKAIPLGLVAYKVKPISFTDFKDILNSCEEIILDGKLIEIKKGISYDYNKKSLYKGGEKLHINKKESIFIELLLKNKNSITTKDDIDNFVWEADEMSEAALKNFLLRLRKKLGKDFFTTVNNIGYKL